VADCEQIHQFSPDSDIGTQDGPTQSRRMKVGDLLRRLLDDGWLLAATRGSHRQFKHPTKPGRVTVAGKPSDDLAPGTVNSILKQAGLRRN
jgi:predicted RNA binding protein YcfA (HicA-like mRNA interferase family)